MKHWLTLSFCITFLTNIYCQSNKYQFETFPAEQLKKDLNTLYNKLDSCHYNLYHYQSKAIFDSTYNALYNGISKPMNVTEFYFHVLPLFNLLKDSHTLLGFPFSYNKTFASQGGKFLPMRVLIKDKKVYITQNLSNKNIPLYSEIKSINNIKIEFIVQQLELLSNREINESEEDYMAFFFHRILYPLYGMDEIYKLEIIDLQNNDLTIELDGISLDMFPKKNNEKMFDFYFLENKKIGVIDINYCEDAKSFPSFCDSVFTILQQEKTNNLIIDLRNNPGGTTFHGDTLLTYLTNNKFTQYAKTSHKHSPCININDDSVYFEEHNQNIEKSYNNSKKYEGYIYMIVNNGTFSSAGVMAATFKCYKMGTLVGQTTGCTEIFFDEPIERSLPNSSLRFLIANNIFYTPCGKEWNKGIAPEIYVKWNKNDLINNIDTEIEFIKKLISTKK